MGWYPQLLTITANPKDWTDFAILILWGVAMPAMCLWVLYEAITKR